MQAIELRHVELGIVTILTGVCAALSVARSPAPCAPAMPEPSAEPVAMRDTETRAITCNAEGITTVVVKGTVSALGPEEMATFHFRFADLPARYSVMTGAHGTFEVRVPREDLGDLDLCDLPMSGQRPASFRDGTMTLRYEVAFER